MKNQCPCGEIGQDNTTNHNEPSGKYITTKSWESIRKNNGIYPCKNHLDNYFNCPYKDELIVNNLCGVYPKKSKVDKNKIQRNLIHAAQTLVNVSKYVEELGITKVAKPSQEERRLRGVLKHIAKYGKNTALHTFKVPSDTYISGTYDVKQMLSGAWTCTCDDYKYRSPKTVNYACKHIYRALDDPDNEVEISYGHGAIESHRRLTTIASEAIEPQDSKRYKVEYNQNYLIDESEPNWKQYSDKSTNLTLSEAKKKSKEYDSIRNWPGWNKDQMWTRVVPV